MRIPSRATTTADLSDRLPRVDVSTVGASVAESLAGLREIDWEHTLRDTSRDSWGPSLLTGVALGTTIGALIALFLTPSTGRELRRMAGETLRVAVGRSTGRESPTADAAGHVGSFGDPGLDAERELRQHHIESI